jgi:C4-dicarboxylate-specific signal transduction histidine kinase
MDEAVSARIFEPFFTTRAADEGTGLGLAVVTGIVTDLGGTISVASKPGAGTRFTLDFPIMRA